MRGDPNAHRPRPVSERQLRVPRVRDRRPGRGGGRPFGGRADRSGAGARARDARRDLAHPPPPRSHRRRGRPRGFTRGASGLCVRGRPRAHPADDEAAHGRRAFRDERALGARAPRPWAHDWRARVRPRRGRARRRRVHRRHALRRGVRPPLRGNSGDDAPLARREARCPRRRREALSRARVHPGESALRRARRAGQRRDHGARALGRRAPRTERAHRPDHGRRRARDEPVPPERRRGRAPLFRPRRGRVRGRRPREGAGGEGRLLVSAVPTRRGPTRDTPPSRGSPPPQRAVAGTARARPRSGAR